MRHLINRDSLVNMLGECPRSYVQRAVLTDDVECLGLFSSVVPGKPQPAWMFTARGIKKEWYIAAVLKNRGRDVGFRIVKDVPWQYWNSENDTGLKAGDNPIVYASKRNFALYLDAALTLECTRGRKDETVPKDM